MSIAPYIKEIGRGKDGARPLDLDQARDLFGQVLDGTPTPAQVGAFCVAMRIKGETSAELQGFWHAAHARQLRLPEAAQAAQGAMAAGACTGIVVLPSYNGARRLPNLTALLAAELAARGCAVLVHGLQSDATRVTTHAVFKASGLPVVQDDTGLSEAWRQGQPAYMDIAQLNAPLSALLAMRWELGLRNPGHTIAKLLQPFAAPTANVSAPASATRVMRVVNHTHPEYAHSLSAFLQDTQADAMLMRGTEGEPVADARRQPRCDVYLMGQRIEALSLQPQEGTLTSLPDWPATCDAAATAAYLHAIVQGHQRCPATIALQADALVRALQAPRPAPSGAVI